jgi:hypothetical protein
MNFGGTFITKASQVKTAEPQLWDFKETLTVWHVKNDPERRQAKVVLAEDVASLANTSGGVLVVGVSDKREIVGIGDGRSLENRLKVARDVLEEFLEYGREIITFRQVGMGEKRDMVCLVIVVSQACSSVGASDGEGRFSYPVRRETGCTKQSQIVEPLPPCSAMVVQSTPVSSKMLSSILAESVMRPPSPLSIRYLTIPNGVDSRLLQFTQFGLKAKRSQKLPEPP